MKKILIASTALILLFTAATIYACGNHDKADLNSAKVDAACSNPQTGSADIAVHHANVVTGDKKSQEAKVMTTEAHGSPNSCGASCPAAGSHKTSTNGAAKESAVKADKVASADSKAKYQSQSVPLVSAPCDLTSTFQR